MLFVKRSGEPRVEIFYIFTQKYKNKRLTRKVGKLNEYATIVFRYGYNIKTSSCTRCTNEIKYCASKEYKIPLESKLNKWWGP